MSEEGYSSHSSALSPAISTIKLLVTISAVVLALQIYVNVPERRAAVACYPIYKIAHFFMVSIPKTVRHNDHEMALNGIIKSENFYYLCSKYAGKLPGVLPPPKNAKEFNRWNT